jgi:hypothetical protein
MASITRVKCRAEVYVGSIVVRTPYIQSFNVRKQRGQVTTFDAALKIPAGTAQTLAGGDVQIWAGENSASQLIVTGMCRAAKVSPCFDDPNFVILSISGADKLSYLQGKKFTRRVREHTTSWASITGVVRAGLKSGKFAYNTEANFKLTSGELQKDDPTSGSRTANAVDGTAPPLPPTGENEGSVNLLVQMFNPKLDEQES